MLFQFMRTPKLLLQDIDLSDQFDLRLKQSNLPPGIRCCGGDRRTVQCRLRTVALRCCCRTRLRASCVTSCRPKRGSVHCVRWKRLRLRGRLFQNSQGLCQHTIPFCSLLNLSVGPRKGLFHLSEHLGCRPIPRGLNPVLINDDDEQTSKQAQGNDVRPEITVLYTILDEQSAAFTETLPVVHVRGIDALEREVDKAILL